MNQNKLLTITIPTYNAHDYLRKCLSSFCMPEIMADIEVVVVNDGSTDDSADIAHEYMDKYPQTFFLISKENGGHGSGINTGIAHATGKYFKVVDADDWVDGDGLARQLEFLKSNDVDIVSSRFLWTYDNGQSEETFKHDEERPIPFTGVQYGQVYRFDDIADKIYIKMHNMTIRTTILTDNHIQIDEHRFYVDTEYILYPIPHVNTVAFLDDVVYMYRLGRSGQSMEMSKMKKNLGMYKDVLESLEDFYESLDTQCTEQKRQYIASLIARVYASMIKIILCMPVSSENKVLLKGCEEKLKNTHRTIYDANINKAVKLLRSSGYTFYPIAAKMAQRKYC